MAQNWGCWSGAGGRRAGGASLTRCRSAIPWRLACCAVALALLASAAAAASTNYYSLLGVRKTADTATIKKAYKDMARKYHPDKYKGPSPVKMEDLNRAHEVLTDPDLRKKYDMYGKDPEDTDVQRAEERRQRQQEYAQFHNIFNHGRRQSQNIESATQTLTAHNYEVRSLHTMRLLVSGPLASNQCLPLSFCASFMLVNVRECEVLASSKFEFVYEFAPTLTACSIITARIFYTFALPGVCGRIRIW